MIGSQNVKHCLSRRYQIVCNYSPMTPPPDGLGTHCCTYCCVSELTQPCEAKSKLLARRVVRIVVKTLIVPKRIHIRRHVPPPSAEASECRDVRRSRSETRKVPWRVPRHCIGGWSVIAELSGHRPQARSLAASASPRIPRSSGWSARWYRTDAPWPDLLTDMPPHYRGSFTASASFRSSARFSSNRLVTSRMIAASPSSSPVSERNGIIVNSSEMPLPLFVVPGTASTSP